MPLFSLQKPNGLVLWAIHGREVGAVWIRFLLQSQFRESKRAPRQAHKCIILSFRLRRATLWRTQLLKRILTLILSVTNQCSGVWSGPRRNRKINNFASRLHSLSTSIVWCLTCSKTLRHLKSAI